MENIHFHGNKFFFSFLINNLQIFILSLTKSANSKAVDL